LWYTTFTASKGRQLHHEKLRWTKIHRQPSEGQRRLWGHYDLFRRSVGVRGVFQGSASSQAGDPLRGHPQGRRRDDLRHHSQRVERMDGRGGDLPLRHLAPQEDRGVLTWKSRGISLLTDAFGASVFVSPLAIRR